MGTFRYFLFFYDLLEHVSLVSCLKCLIIFFFFLNRDQVLRIHAESENHIQILKKLKRDVDSGVSVKSLLIYFEFCLIIYVQYDMEISQIVDYILCDPLAGFLDSCYLC